MKNAKSSRVPKIDHFTTRILEIYTVVLNQQFKNYFLMKVQRAPFNLQPIKHKNLNHSTDLKDAQVE